MKKKVLIPTKLDALAAKILAGHGGFDVVQDESAELADLAAQHGDAYALIVRSEAVTAQIIDALPKLKLVVRAGAGYNTIDTTYARSRGVDVMNTPGANANAVAEEVVAMMLADARHVLQADPSARSGKWEKKRFMGRELTGKCIGIVGVGYIGQTLIKRLRGFEMKVLGYDPVLSQERARDIGVELVDLPTLFSEADYISLHVPENDQTRKMVNSDLLSRMKPGATIVNCARAGILDVDAMRTWKEKSGLRLLNDVYPKDVEGEKPIAEVADLMLPHLGASTVEANQTAARRAAEQLIGFVDEGNMSYIVNRDVPAGLDEAFGTLAFKLAKLARAMVGEQSQLKVVETSFYGSLKPYANWLIMPTLAALSEGFDRSMDYAMALQYMRDMGIEYEDRETDDTKGFQNSITLDVTAARDKDNLRHVSVRGTVAENNVMIARIDDFDSLYFDPDGHNVVFVYADRPGVLGTIAARLAAAKVNIDDVRNPHDSKGEESIAIVKVNQPVSEDVIGSIVNEIEARVGFYAEL